MTNLTHVDAVRPDPAAITCFNCEHTLARHTLTGSGTGPNGTNRYTCGICGPASGTHLNGQTQAIVEPRRSTRVIPSDAR